MKNFQVLTSDALFTPEDYAEGVVIPIDKPYGWTSADVVRKVKFSLQRKLKLKNIKVGHAGTLDPLATGVLLLCIGKATRQAETLQAEEKEYIAKIQLGATTPSFDLEKEIDARFPYKHITRQGIEDALNNFIGTQEQVAPLFSAKIINGKRAYELARAGKEAVLKPSIISIYETELLCCDLPNISVRICCSKGTYIRSFARDLGLILQSGGHLTGLQRSRSGNFNVMNSWELDDLINFFAEK